MKLNKREVFTESLTYDFTVDNNDKHNTLDGGL